MRQVRSIGRALPRKSIIHDVSYLLPGGYVEYDNILMRPPTQLRQNNPSQYCTLHVNPKMICWSPRTMISHREQKCRWPRLVILLPSSGKKRVGRQHSFIFEITTLCQTQWKISLWMRLIDFVPEWLAHIPSIIHPYKYIHSIVKEWLFLRINSA